MAPRSRTLRRDALVVAALFTLATRDEARTHGGVATVGEITCVDGAANVIPGHVDLVLDKRHPDPSRLAEMAAAARRACERISEVED